MTPILNLEPRSRADLERLHAEWEWRRCALDFRYFVETYVYIEDKTSTTGVSLFKPLPHQQEVIDAFLTERRLLVLKARQLGFTTITMAYILWLVSFRPGTSALVLSHKDTYAKANVSRLRLMYGFLPPWMRERLPKPNDASNSFILDFGDGRVSNVESLPATAKVGASMTLDFIFLDEFGLMTYADTAYDTLVPTVDAAMKSPRPGCVLAIGSTARGSAGAFPRMWRSRSTIKKLFFPWWCSPNFTQADYDREASDYAERGEPWRIYQERPANPEEAFRKSGAAFFATLDDLDVDEYPSHLRGRMAETDDGEAVFVPDPNGPLHLAEEPDPNQYYVLSVDPAHGVENDSTVGTLLSYDEAGDPYIAAYWASNDTSQADAALHLDLLGRYYAGTQRAALLVPETTGGHAELFIHVWRSREYPNLYSFTPVSQRRKRLAPSYGLNTAGAGGKRQLVLGRLAEYLPRLGNVYPALREELGTFVRKEGSDKVAADTGCHDDHVLAVAIGLWALVERGHAPRVPLDRGTSAPAVLSVAHIFTEVEKVRQAEEALNERRAAALNRRAYYR